MQWTIWFWWITEPLAIGREREYQSWKHSNLKRLILNKTFTTGVIWFPIFGCIKQRKCMVMPRDGHCFGLEIHPDPWNTRNKTIGYIDRISEFYSNLYYLHTEKKAHLGEIPYVFSNSVRMVSDRSLRKQWKLLEPIGVARCFIDQLVWVQVAGDEDGSLWGQKVGSWCCFVCFWRVWRLFHLEFFLFFKASLSGWSGDGSELVQEFFWAQKKMMNEDLSLSRWGSVVFFGRFASSEEYSLSYGLKWPTSSKVAEF